MTAAQALEHKWLSSQKLPGASDKKLAIGRDLERHVSAHKNSSASFAGSFDM
jgi:hypothetical protein